MILRRYNMNELTYELITDLTPEGSERLNKYIDQMEIFDIEKTQLKNSMIALIHHERTDAAIKAVEYWKSN